MNFKLNGITLALLTGLATSPVWAQTTTSGTTTGTTATNTSTSNPAPATATNPTNKLTSQFSQWAGSTENANALITGLRSGKPITLTSTTTTAGDTSGTATGGTTATSTSTTFTPPTKPMGYGNIKIALSLAKTQLAQQGITQPTPQQLQTALNGGQLATGSGTTAQTTNMQGVLQMRSSGMGWGQIANSMGVKLGAVMSGKANVAAATGTTTTASGTTAATGKAQGKSITTGDAGTASGKSQGQSKGITTAGGSGNANSAAGKANGKSGITTASGGSGSGSISTGAGQGGGHGNSAVTTAGGAAKGNAGGNSSSHGKSGK